MNYLKHYISLMRKAKQRNYSKKKAKKLNIYVEGHHIFPVSIFGKNKKIVYLTAREHYIAHALLKNIFIKRYGKYNDKTKKMIYAFWRLNNETKQNNYTNSHLYENSKILFIETLKQDSIFNGDKNPSKTMKRRIELSENMSNFLYSLTEEEYKNIYNDRIEKTKKIFKGDGNPFYNKKHTEEIKEIIGNRTRGTKWWNDGTRSVQSKKCPGDGWILGMCIKNRPVKKRNKDIVEKIRESNCKYIYTFISPENKIIKSPYAKEICQKYNLNYVSIIKVVNGYKKNYKGWKIYRDFRNNLDK